MVLQLVLTAVCAWLPLYNDLGYEYALASTLAVVAWAPLIGLQQGRRGGPTPWGPCRAMAPALTAQIPALGLMLALHVVLPPCNLGFGLALYALMPLGSAATGALLGYLVGTLTARGSQKWAFCALGLALLTSLALMLARLYFEPPVTLYDCLWGFFSGSLFDEALAVPTALWAVRRTTVALILAVTGVAWANARRTPARLLLGYALLLAAAYQSYVLEPRAGTRNDHRAIAAALSQTRHLPGLTVHLPQELPPQLADSIAQDHFFRLQTLSERMGLINTPSSVLHSYVYPSAGAKLALIGCGSTMIAKPWLREMHLHDALSPHPLLAHEMVHALAAPWAPGPLHISARFRLWVTMGLTEGLAVALAPDGLGPGLRQKTRELYAMGLGVPLEQLMGGPTQFWALAPMRAYAQAGALVRYIEARFGMATVAAMYRCGGLGCALSISPQALEHDFRAWLGPAQAPNAPEVALARAQLAVPSMFARSCPHEVARLRQQAAAARGRRAAELWQQVALYRGHKPVPEDNLAWARAEATAGNRVKAKQLLSALCQQPGLSPSLRAQAQVLWAQLEALALMAEAKELTPSPLAHLAPFQSIKQVLHRALDQDTEGHAAKPAWLTLWALDQPRTLGEAVISRLSQAGPAEHLEQLLEQAGGHRDDPTVHLMLGQLRMTSDPAGALKELAHGPHPFAPLNHLRLTLACHCAYRAERWRALAKWAQALEAAPSADLFRAWAQDLHQRAAFELAAKAVSDIKP